MSDNYNKMFDMNHDGKLNAGEQFLEYMMFNEMMKEEDRKSLNDVDWSKFVSALTDIRYDGFTCLEVEDKAFEGSEEDVLKSLRLSKRYLDQFVI